MSFIIETNVIFTDSKKNKVEKPVQLSLEIPDALPFANIKSNKQEVIDFLEFSEKVVIKNSLTGKQQVYHLQRINEVKENEKIEEVVDEKQD